MFFTDLIGHMDTHFENHCAVWTGFRWAGIGNTMAEEFYHSCPQAYIKNKFLVNKFLVKSLAFSVSHKLIPATISCSCLPLLCVILCYQLRFLLFSTASKKVFLYCFISFHCAFLKKKLKFKDGFQNVAFWVTVHFAGWWADIWRGPYSYIMIKKVCGRTKQP